MPYGISFKNQNNNLSISETFSTYLLAETGSLSSSGLIDFYGTPTTNWYDTILTRINFSTQYDVPPLVAINCPNHFVGWSGLLQNPARTKYTGFILNVSNLVYQNVTSFQTVPLNSWVGTLPRPLSTYGTPITWKAYVSGNYLNTNSMTTANMGIKIYRDNSSIAFDSRIKPLIIKNIVADTRASRPQFTDRWEWRNLSISGISTSPYIILNNIIGQGSVYGEDTESGPAVNFADSVYQICTRSTTELWHGWSFPADFALGSYGFPEGISSSLNFIIT